MNVGREEQGGEAIGVVNLDSAPSPKALEAVQSHPDILSVSVIKLPAQARCRRGWGLESSSRGSIRYGSLGGWRARLGIRLRPAGRELIAQHPVEPRDRSRLMVVDRRRGTWEHRVFADLPELLDPRDVLVRNDTRVVPARLVGHREATGGRWEGLFLRERPGGTWEILAKTRGRPAIGEPWSSARGFAWCWRPGESRAMDRPAAVRIRIRPTRRSTALALLERHGQTPLPPYIRRGREGPGDRLAYQTVYARRPGSAAAPTAGLHFTPELLDRLARRGIACVDLTLHVGLGTFRPIEADRLEDHVMHAEWAELPPRPSHGWRNVGARGDGSWPSAPPRPGPSRPRPLRGPCEPFAGETATLHPARPRLPRPRRPDHQLPPAAQQPARAGQRPGRDRPDPRRLRRRDQEPSTGSSAMATPC